MDNRIPKIIPIPSCANLTTYIQGSSDYEILCEVVSVVNQLIALTPINSITYADPFQWDITKQYAKNTLVLYTDNMCVYMSVDNVPVGVDIKNAEYWTVVCDMSGIYNQLISAITSLQYSLFDMPATSNINVNDLVWINNELYKCTSAVNAGSNVTKSSFAKTTLSSEFINLIANYNNEIESVTSELNSRISNIIANGTPTEGNTELIDIRNGWDGTNYKTAGDAVRYQVKNTYDFSSSIYDGIGISFTNLLNESNIYINNAIITNTGKVQQDNRGFRIYVLKLGKQRTVTISVDLNWFYVIQADSNQYSLNGKITGADTSTYVDSLTATPNTQLTVTTTHDYLWMCFMHNAPSPELDRYTNEIMVNEGASPLPYVSYNNGASINVKNLKDSSSTPSVYSQAYIYNQELIADNIPPNGGSVAQYTCIKMPGNVVSIKAKVKFYGGGTAYTTFISEPNGQYTVEDVTKKSVHVNMSSTTCYIGYFDNKKLTNTRTLNYSAAEGVEVEVGFDIDTGTNTITVYTPDGNQTAVTDINYVNSIGNFACIEHYIYTKSVAFSCNKIAKIYIEDADGNFVLDDFNRENGAVGVSPQGIPYAQFNSDMQDRSDAHL